VQVSFAYVNHAKDAATADSLNSFFLAEALGQEYIGMTPAEAVDAYVKRYADDYRRDMEPVYNQDQTAENKESDKEEMEGWYAFYREISTEPMYRNSHIMVYQVDYGEYTGGAHGIYMTTFLNLDLQRLSPIRLDDLFDGDYKAALTELLWSQLLTDNKLKNREEAEDMGYASTGNLEPTENFYLSDKGITFYYNIYEITPYVMGPVSITLPYDAVRPLLRDSIAKAYNL
jgi:hypothetical protein